MQLEKDMLSYMLKKNEAFYLKKEKMDLALSLW